MSDTKSRNLWVPSPFLLAVLLTFFTFLMAWKYTEPKEAIGPPYLMQLMDYWRSGFWGFLAFGMQMMLILVLGYVVALSKPVDSILSRIVGLVKDTSTAAALVVFVAMGTALVNWGFGLIVGAILARKIGEYAHKNRLEIHYPMVGAAGYGGLMIWHGGLSGSGPLKINEIGSDIQALGLSEPISLDTTLFSWMNLGVGTAVMILVTLLMYLLGKRVKEAQGLNLSSAEKRLMNEEPAGSVGIGNVILPIIFVVFIFASTFYYIGTSSKSIFKLIDLNFINFTLLGLAIAVHGTFERFVQAVEKSINSCSGILIQFPLYAGIMGVMRDSGLIQEFSDMMVRWAASNPDSLPIYTFFSAAIVNFFVPSGGGQFMVQAPIVVEAANGLSVSVSKCMMALAYGDQLTNMLQPFWALPLLGITGLKARDIFPYTVLMMLVGFVVFLVGLTLA